MRKNHKRNFRRAALALTLAVALGLAFAEHFPPLRPPFGAARPSASPTATPVPTPMPTPVPTPEPTPSPTPEPTPAPRVDPDGKMIALTFDDGPGPGTQRILNALDTVNGRATFFMLGNRMDQYASLARKVARQGSEVATHSWSHPNLAKLEGAQLNRELSRSLDAIERATGVRPKVLRPPYGSVNQAVQDASRKQGLRIANWNIDPEDWRVRDADAVYRHIMNNARDGAIVVCHDLYAETASAIESAARDLTARGYQLVTVSELLAARADGGEAGRIYYAA